MSLPIRWLLPVPDNLSTTTPTAGFISTADTESPVVQSSLVNQELVSVWSSTDGPTPGLHLESQSMQLMDKITQQEPSSTSTEVASILAGYYVTSSESANTVSSPESYQTSLRTELTSSRNVVKTTKPISPNTSTRILEAIMSASTQVTSSTSSDTNSPTNMMTFTSSENTTITARFQSPWNSTLKFVNPSVNISTSGNNTQLVLTTSVVQFTSTTRLLSILSTTKGCYCLGVEPGTFAVADKLCNSLGAGNALAVLNTMDKFLTVTSMLFLVRPNDQFWVGVYGVKGEGKMWNVMVR